MFRNKLGLVVNAAYASNGVDASNVVDASNAADDDGFASTYHAASH
jgi:hypothetical protein